MKAAITFCRLKHLYQTCLHEYDSVKNTYWKKYSKQSFYTSSQLQRKDTGKPIQTKNIGNPLAKLQPFSQVPIIPAGDEIFDPRPEEVDNGVKMFQHKGKQVVKFVTSAVTMNQLPDIHLPEVAFIGRSNVGKSSLIQALFLSVPDVKVKISSKPGHTRTLNFFQVGRSFTLVDMPGYGHNMPEHFAESVEGYMKTRRRLCRTFILIDGEVGITKSDEIGLQMMEDLAKPYVIVMTKIDKASRHILLRNILDLIRVRDKCTSNSCFPQPFLVSSKTGEGVSILQAFIAYITGCIHIEGL